MKHVGRIVIVVVILFVLSVVWYATKGQAFLTRVAFTNDATIAAGTTWVASDAGLNAISAASRSLASVSRS